MGSGGGGGYSGIYSSEDLSRKTREAEENAQNQAFITTVNEYLDEKLREYNNRDCELIRSIIEDFQNSLSSEEYTAIQTIFGGSVSKHTYVDGISDVDALILIDRKQLENKSPREVRDILGELAKQKYGKENVTIGNMAITIFVQGNNIQLLPAIKYGSNYKISSQDGSEWSSIKPKEFTEKLTSINKTTNNKAIPTIKLAKAIISNLPPQQKLSGYHVESLAVRIFSEYKGPYTNKEMLSHFFCKAGELVKTRLKDKTGQSSYVDEYLGKPQSVERRTTANALDRIYRSIKNADGSFSIEKWKSFFDN